MIEDAKPARYAESFAASHRHAFAIIHRQEIGVERGGQGDGGCRYFFLGLGGMRKPMARVCWGFLSR